MTAAAWWRTALERAGHPGLTVSNERAMQAVDAGADTAASLARATGVSRQAAAKTIDVLESLGYVERVADRGDARKKVLQVTPSGRSAVAVGAEAFDRVFHRWQREDEASARATIAGLQ